MANEVLPFGGVKDVREKLLKHSTKNYYARKISDITHIAVHHSLTATGSAEAFARHHVNKNDWPGIGYHFVIEKDGTVKWCNDIGIKTYHVGKSNKFSIGICITGDFRNQTLEDIQFKPLIKLIKNLMKHFNIDADNVWGHSQFPDYSWKKCPCINMGMVRSNLSVKNEPEGVTQEELFTNGNNIYQPKQTRSKEERAREMVKFLSNPNDFLLRPGESVMKAFDIFQGFDLPEVKSHNKTLPGNKPVTEPTVVKVKGPVETIPPKVGQIIKQVELKGYKVFKSDSKNYNLNLVGMRNNNAVPNSFDDKMYVFWKWENKWNLKEYKITTDPGITYLNDPLVADGTAILKEGQYCGAYSLGKHRGKYDALVQSKPVTVLRDDNKDSTLDFDTKKERTGMFGINIHRSSARGESTLVDKWSAGCQVFAMLKEYNEFIRLCKLARDEWGNSFTYTLLREWN